MTTPPVKPPDQGVLLEECLQNEERRLRDMQSKGANWLRLFEQRRRIARGQRALEWADTRREGESQFMWWHGLKVGFAGFISTFLVSSFVSGFSLPITLSVVLSVAVGGVGGLFGGLMEWERRERELEKALAALLPKPQG